MNDSDKKIKSLTRWWRFVFTLLCTLFVTVACHHDGSIPENYQSQNTACRQVEHGAGMYCVPEKFERLVTLDDASLENAIALGIKPVGSVISDFSSYWQEHLTGVKNIGIDRPDLESILAVKPDLIVGFEYHKRIYNIISKIAPTALLKFENSGQWKEVFTKFSLVLGKHEVGEAVMKNYYRRLEQFKQKMGNKLSKTQVSVVRVYPSNINIYLLDSFCGKVLQDAGLSRPASQNITASEAKRLFGNPIQVSIGNELVEKADGDVIFIWTGQNTSQGSATAKKNLEQLQSSPIWKNLKAVKGNQVYLVPSYWIGSGMLAANAIVDDLFKYLLNQP